MRTLKFSRIHNHVLLKRLKSERGSALVEFLVLGLPLFLPLAIFLGGVYESAHLHFSLENYSRQLARAYVTSPDQNTAIERMNFIKSEFQELFAKGNQLSSSPDIDIKCSANPCLTKGSVVEIVVTAFKRNSNVKYASSTSESVDEWRN